MAGFILNGFNIGTDFSATLVDNFGNLFPLANLGLLMEFDSESMDKELEVTPISQGGVPVFMTIWAGCRGRMMFTRINGNLDNMIADLMSAYFNQGITPTWTIAASVQNRDGSIDEFQYSGVSIGKPKLGTYRAEKEVDESLEFRASLFTRTGAGAAFLDLAA